MPAPFPHTCTISRPNPDDSRPINGESGQPVGEAPAPLLLYRGRCHFDEAAQTVKRQMGGDVDVEGKAVLVLPKTAVLLDQDTDEVSVSANGYRYSGAGILRVSYNRRRIVLVLDLQQRPTLA